MDDANPEGSILYQPDSKCGWPRLPNTQREREREREGGEGGEREREREREGEERDVRERARERGRERERSTFNLIVASGTNTKKEPSKPLSFLP